MTVLAGWADTYYMATLSGATDTALVSSATCKGTYGIGLPKIYTTNAPTFDKAYEVTTQKRHTGQAYLYKDEYFRTRYTPTTSFEFPMEAATMFLPLALLFQGGTFTTSAAVSEIFQPDYTAGDPTYFAALLRNTEDGESHEIRGAVCNSMSISGSVGEFVNITTDYIGSAMSTAAALCSLPQDASGTSSQIFADVTVLVDSSAATPTAFSLDITNNAYAIHRSGSYAPYKIILGEFECTGSISIPWDDTNYGKNAAIEDLDAGETVPIVLYWGDADPDSVGEVAIRLNAKLESAPASAGDDESIIEINFTCVYDGANATYPFPVEIEIFDAVDRTTYFS